MTREFSRPRRFAAALAALLCSVFLFREQIADALVIRGDEYLYRGKAVEALERYRRAMHISPLSETATDRYVFVSMQIRDADALKRAILVADRYLVSRPNDPAVLSDRALCYLHLRRYALAQADFVDAARSAHTANYYVFAGWTAQHRGRKSSARELWRAALSIDPRYGPAVRALAEHRT